MLVEVGEFGHDGFFQFFAQFWQIIGGVFIHTDAHGPFLLCAVRLHQLVPEGVLLLGIGVLIVSLLAGLFWVVLAMEHQGGGLGVRGDFQPQAPHGVGHRPARFVGHVGRVGQYVWGCIVHVVDMLVASLSPELGQVALVGPCHQVVFVVLHHPEVFVGARCTHGERGALRDALLPLGADAGQNGTLAASRSVGESCRDAEGSSMGTGLAHVDGHARCKVLCLGHGCFQHDVSPRIFALVVPVAGKIHGGGVFREEASVPAVPLAISRGVCPCVLVFRRVEQLGGVAS